MIENIENHKKKKKEKEKNKQPEKNHCRIKPSWIPAIRPACSGKHAESNMVP